MQNRHLNRRRYFCELANTARDFYLDYLRPHVALTAETKVLEIGCGEGGNLLPFAEIGCQVTGIDISEGRIEQARLFFESFNKQGTFICQNFVISEKPKTEMDRYDLVIVHDVIEHIEPPYKLEFLTHIKPFLKQDGLVFFGFPAWQNPFGGHQQISTGFVSKLPFVHLLPNFLYRGILRMSGASQSNIDELMSIKRSRMPVEKFERLSTKAGYLILKRTLWLINPHYKQKFHLKPRRQWAFASRIPYIRNYYTTSAFYLLKIKK